jgi:outer membrane receptor protein involved in Fe transport
MYRKILITACLLIISVSLSFSQRGRGNFDPSQMPKKGIITGKILDAETGAGLPSASIYLYSLKDSSVVSGALTTSDGSFEIDKLAFGKYHITVKYIGYKELDVDDITIKPDNFQINLGNINISADDISTDEIEVTAERLQIEYKVDKKVITPNNDITSAGGSAVEVLENVPSVTVDIEGNVSLRGSTNFTVFINGRPSVLDANDALEQIPASTIENIELITNPSVKYDPDGVAGIININLKEQEESGWSGMTDISAGSYDNYSLNALLNYKVNGLTIFGGVNYRDSKRIGEGTFLQRTSRNGSVTSLDYQNDMNRGRYGLDLKGGITYDLGRSTTFSLEGRYGQFEFSRNFASNIQEFQSSLDSLSYSKNKSLVSRNRDFYAINFDFIQRFDDPRHTLTASVYLSDRSGGGDDEQKVLPANQSWDIVDGYPLMTRSKEIEKSGDLRVKLDYVNPINENSMFEAGGQFEMDPEEEDNIFENYDPENNSWSINDDFSSAYEFVRNTSAIYSTYSNKLYGINFKLGLRGEYTYRFISLKDTAVDYSIDRFDLFPSIHISSNIDEDNQIYASYGRRIQRPWGRSLEPSKVYRDQYNYNIGNPELEPEYVNSFELGYLRYFGKSMVSLEGYFRQTNNIITRVQIPEEGGLIKNTYMNLNQDYSTGIEIMSNLDLLEWLNINASMDFYNYWLEGKLEGQNVDNNTFVWGANMKGTVKITPTTRFQADMFYRGPSITAQGKSAEFWGTNLAIRQELMDRNLSLVFQVRDLFNTWKREFTIDQPDFYSYFYMTPYSPQFTLTISYKFNNFEKKRNGMNGEGMENVIDSDF